MVVAAVLQEGAVRQADEHRTGAQPFLQRLVGAQLVEVVALPADADPEADACRVTERPEHRHFVVAQQYLGVVAITGKSQTTDTEHAVVDEVAKKEGAPPVRGIRLQRRE